MVEYDTCAPEDGPVKTPNSTGSLLIIKNIGLPESPVTIGIL
jgi:hypothetical protein